MGSTSRMPAWVTIVAAATAAGLLIVAGCTLEKTESRPQTRTARPSRNGKPIPA